MSTNRPAAATEETVETSVNKSTNAVGYSANYAADQRPFPILEGEDRNEKAASGVGILVHIFRLRDGSSTREGAIIVGHWHIFLGLNLAIDPRAAGSNVSKTDERCEV